MRFFKKKNLETLFVSLEFHPSTTAAATTTTTIKTTQRLNDKQKEFVERQEKSHRRGVGERLVDIAELSL